MCRTTSILLGTAVSLVLCSSLQAATYVVSQSTPGAADTNPGTAARPLLTINAALSRVEPGDTIFVQDGIYREDVRYPKGDWGDPELRITLSAAPGHKPVICGSDVLTGPWERLPGDRPIYATPREAYTQMVFCDAARLRQIGLQGNPERAEKSGGFRYQKQWDGKGLQDMAPGSFFYDTEGRRLCLWLADGTDPLQHLIEVAVRTRAITLQGTWTLGGFDVRHVADGRWPDEQAVVVSGNRCVVEGCRIIDNEFLGLIVSGQDCTVRGNTIARNGLMGFTSNVGYRMLFEGNELHDNAWRGDVECLTAGNKLVMWRDSRFVRNWWHDEPASALWLDISDGNCLVAENRFDNCAVAIYFEIGRWGVIANNVLRNCGRGIWIYSSDALVAHNVLDGCGEGITVTGGPRLCNYNQTVSEPGKYCMMAVRNNLIVNNLLIDCPGSYVGITPDDAFGAGNYSDYNAFVWTLPIYHRTGSHISFMAGWNTLYARLPEWRYQRHYDTHSVVSDPGLLKEAQAGSQWIAMDPRDIVGDPRLAARELGDYRLQPDSPLRGRGVKLPLVLASAYRPCVGSEVVSRQFAKTLLADAPDPAQARSVYGGDEGHYRVQPLPRFQRLADLDDQPPDTPGLNPIWSQTGQYPMFDSSRPADTATDEEWAVSPDNRLQDPSFIQPIAMEGEGPGPWFGRGGVHMSAGVACANLLAGQTSGVLAFQKVGKVAAGCECILFGDMSVASADGQLAATGTMELAVGDELQPVGDAASARAEPGKSRSWNTYLTRYRAGAAEQDEKVGRDLYVVIRAATTGPAETATSEPVAFVRWDNLTLLTAGNR